MDGRIEDTILRLILEEQLLWLEETWVNFTEVTPVLLVVSLNVLNHDIAIIQFKKLSGRPGVWRLYYAVFAVPDSGNGAKTVVNL